MNFAFAQDIHYSQFNASPQNLNPAQTGLFDGDWRFVGNFRSQWSVIPVPYRTFSIATDTRLKTKLENDVPAVGLIINTDKSGDSKFTTTQIFASGAYIKKLNKDSTHFVSVGIQPGVTSKSFNLAALTFEDSALISAQLLAQAGSNPSSIKNLNECASLMTYLRDQSSTVYAAEDLAAVQPFLCE